MTDFVHDLEAELLRAARRRARPKRRLHPPALLVAALVAAALLVVALTPRAAKPDRATTGTPMASCLFPDVAHLLSDRTCSSDPFRP